MEDQVTCPVVSAMLGAPKVKDIRGLSDSGYSYVYIIFKEGTDIYRARSRMLEYLSSVLPRLPQGCKPNSVRMRPASARCFNTRWSMKAERTAWPNCGLSMTGS